MRNGREFHGAREKKGEKALHEEVEEESRGKGEDVLLPVMLARAHRERRKRCTSPITSPHDGNFFPS